MLLKLKIFWVRLCNWEYWPIYIINFPVLFIYLWFALKARSFMFFANVNPSIPTGGLFGESKKDIYDLLPPDTYPATFYAASKPKNELVLQWMKSMNMDFPIICKPDVGERGYQVEIIRDVEKLSSYGDAMAQPYLIQAFVDYPLELSIVAYSYPDKSQSGITSICYKQPLTVIGDGISTLLDLMTDKPRALLQVERLRPKWGEKYKNIIPSEEVVLLEGIGNHSRGSKFIDWNDRYNETIRDTFVSLLDNMKGVTFGRFDIKCISEDDFILGRNFQIIEFNGVGGEPAHVYDPRHSFWYMIRSSYDHWSLLYKISKLQQKTHKIPSLKEGLKLYKIYKNKISF